MPSVAANKAGLHLFGGHPPLSEDLWATTGRIFWVGATAVPGGVAGVDDSGSYGDRPQYPFATLDYAIGQCTASRGDRIVVLPGHTETLSAAVAIDVAAIGIIGLGTGRNRPAFTVSAAAIDGLDVSVANVQLHNLRVIGNTASVTALLNISAADCVATKCVFEPAATPLASVTVASGGHRFVFQGCYWYGSANGPDFCIDIESSASDDWVIEDCVANFSVAGLDNAFIRANADATTGGVMRRVYAFGLDTLAIDFNSSGGAATCDGMISDCRFMATAALTSIEDIVDPGRYTFFEVYAHDLTNVTTAAARIPIGTVS